MNCETNPADCVPCEDDRHGTPCCLTHCGECRSECYDFGAALPAELRADA